MARAAGRLAPAPAMATAVASPDPREWWVVLLVRLPVGLLGPWLPVVVLWLSAEASVRLRHLLSDRARGLLAA